MAGDRERVRARLAEPRGAVRELHRPAFGDLLRRYRRAAGLTQEQLAERAGLSPAGISALERGARASPQRETVRLLADALGLSPDERAWLAAAVVARHAPNAGGTPRTQLPGFVPLAAGELVGRDEAVRAVRALLGREAVRLLTITGPGGVGKTRLALEVAALSRAHYRDGVTVLALDAVRTATDALSLLARRLGLGDQHRGPLLEAVVAALRERRTLQVLDNVEHLLPFVATIDAILEACPGVQVLATSRAALRSPWETLYRLGPLALPDPDAPDAAAIDAAPAVALFVARCRVVRPDFRLTVANAPTVAAICRQLEGLPLALELAAPRLRLLAPAQLLARLGERLPLLAGGAAAAGRHHTMRETIAWSYALLRPEEQRVFRALAAFTGSYTTEAAEVVCTEAGECPAVPTPPAPSPPSGVLAALEALVDQSLAQVIVADSDEVPRLTMLETIREYAGEQLLACGEAGAVEARHRRYYRTLAREGAAARGTDLAVWLDRCERDYPNLRLALERALAAPEATAALADGLALLVALRLLWEVRGYGVEGRRWAEGYLQRAASTAVRPDLRIAALTLAGTLALRQGDLEPAEASLRQAVAAAREMDQRGVLAAALCVLGEVGRFRGQRDEARAALEESLTLATECGDPAAIADASLALGILATASGRPEEAARHLTEAVDTSRAASDLWSLARALSSLAAIPADQGDVARAIALTEEALALFRRVGDRRGVAIALGNLGNSYMALGEYERAETVLTEGLAIRGQLHDRAGVAHVSLVLATVANRRRDATRAEAWFREGIAAARAADDRRLVAVGLDGLASIRRQRGDLAAARALHAACLRLVQATRLYRRVAGMLEGAALTEAAAGEWCRAARLCGAAAAERERHDQRRDTGAFHATVLAALTDSGANLGDAAFAEAWGAGARLPPAAAVAHLLEEYATLGVMAPDVQFE